MPIRLRFVQGASAFSAVISRAQLGDAWTHVEAVCPDGRWLGALLSEGVQARAAGYDKSWTAQQFATLVCPDNVESRFYDYLFRQIGCPYDNEAIALLAAGFLTGSAPVASDHRAVTCAALQTEALLWAHAIDYAPLGSRLALPRDVMVAFGAATRDFGQIEVNPNPPPPFVQPANQAWFDNRDAEDNAT